MKNANGKPELRIRIDTHHCHLSDAVRAKMESDIGSLARQVAEFPIAEMQILVERNARSNDYSVKTSLILPGNTLVGNGHDAAVGVAFQSCLQSLEENVRGYKERLDRQSERQKQEKGTHHDLLPSVDPDPSELARAIDDDDYDAFRTATFGYEEAVRQRAGRWIERYPEVAARLGKGLDMDDVVESVFLDAFEGYKHRSREVRFGDWLDSLIDPAIKALRSHPEDQLENIRLVRTAREAQEKRRPG
jgi:ribosome-associated translation inhibitor RaiA